MLCRLPQARLLLNIGFADAATFLDRLGERGVPAEQIEVVAWA